jgi:hypothetical protein
VYNLHVLSSLHIVQDDSAPQLNSKGNPFHSICVTWQCEGLSSNSSYSERKYYFWNEILKNLLLFIVKCQLRSGSSFFAKWKLNLEFTDRKTENFPLPPFSFEPSSLFWHVTSPPESQHRLNVRSLYNTLAS